MNSIFTGRRPNESVKDDAAVEDVVDAQSETSVLDLPLDNRRKPRCVRPAVRDPELRSSADDLGPAARSRRLVEAEAVLVSAHDKLHSRAVENSLGIEGGTLKLDYAVEFRGAAEQKVRLTIEAARL